MKKNKRLGRKLTGIIDELYRQYGLTDVRPGAKLKDRRARLREVKRKRDP